jgi:DNA-binding beta-propeller fold protein YncE
MGVSAGRMDLPMGVCADPSGNIYVADTCNHRIQKRSVAGEWSVLAGVSPDSYKCYVPEWLGSGTVPGQFNLPKAVAADASGNIYVADSGNHRIQIFDAKSGEWTAIGKQGPGIGEFDHPSGIAVDSLGTIYISDTRNHRIVVLKVKK